MKQAEFCYWAQGYFEITEALGDEYIATVSISQQVVIRNHLELVKQCSKAPVTGFCAWLDGALDMAPVADNSIEPVALSKIREKLNAEFLHVIDPKMPGDKEVLQAIHDGLQLPSLLTNPHRPHNARC